MTGRSDESGEPTATATDRGESVRRLDDWDGAFLRSLAAEYETPLYVLDLDRVRANYRRLASAFPDADICYAAKANALGDVLETLLAEGATIECASAGEVQRALAAGASGDRIHYTAVNPPERDLEYVLDVWADEPHLTITAGARDTVERLADAGYDGRLALRVNPGVGAGHHDAVRTGGDATFGIPADRLVGVAEFAVESGLDLVGLHAHVGSGVLDDEQVAAHREFVGRVAALAEDILSAVGPVDFVDVGGGFGVPYRESESPLDLDAVAGATRDALVGVDADLVVEPGRYLVADAGLLLTRANTVKETPGTRVVGVDAGMTSLLRPALYDAYHDIRPVAPGAADRDRVAQTITGPICESADVFCTDRPLPRIDREEPLAVGNAGAYGYEMASTYNSRPRPASVVVDAGSVSLARRRESIDDLTRLERNRADAGTERAPGAAERAADGTSPATDGGSSTEVDE
ncbi:diaminopimelate decarboxylase [Halovivax limisalsi]|uniref:diaminopimelate decarboxylase n=1 Tax=Halovivax limisalsi TaxID=1453760 RepID=UPI001FFD03D8|nr:diaminopimelate decarboxylase [Halovivax limisalsi]